MEDGKIDLFELEIGIDDTDMKILNLLVDDCRISYAEIAREVHLSRMAVRDRVIKMIENGIIEKFTLKLNARKIGLRASVYLNIQTKPRQMNDVVRELTNHPNIESVYSVTGTNALHVHAFLKDISRVETFIDEIYKISGIDEVEFNIMARKYKSTRLFT